MLGERCALVDLADVGGPAATFADEVLAACDAEAVAEAGSTADAERFGTDLAVAGKGSVGHFETGDAAGKGGRVVGAPRCSRGPQLLARSQLRLSARPRSARWSWRSGALACVAKIEVEVEVRVESSSSLFFVVYAGKVTQGPYIVSIYGGYIVASIYTYRLPVGGLCVWKLIAFMQAQGEVVGRPRSRSAMSARSVLGSHSAITSLTVVRARMGGQGLVTSPPGR